MPPPPNAPSPANRAHSRKRRRTEPQQGGRETPERRQRQRAGPGAAQPCDPSCPASATSMHALPPCPARATHTGTAASPSRVCHHGVRGRSTVRQALRPDNRDSPSPVVSAQRRELTVGPGVRHRPCPKPNQTPPPPVGPSGVAVTGALKEGGSGTGAPMTRSPSARKPFFFHPIPSNATHQQKVQPMTIGQVLVHCTLSCINPGSEKYASLTGACKSYFKHHERSGATNVIQEGTAKHRAHSDSPCPLSSCEWDTLRPPTFACRDGALATPVAFWGSLTSICTLAIGYRKGPRHVPQTDFVAKGTTAHQYRPHGSALEILDSLAVFRPLLV